MITKNPKYYHILIETIDKSGPGSHEDPITVCDVSDLEYLKNNYLKRYLQHNLFKCDGYKLDFDKIKRIKIISTDFTLDQINDSISQKQYPECLFMLGKADLFSSNYATEITNDILLEIEHSLGISSEISLSKKVKKSPALKPRKIFIIHGHNETLKLTIARLLSKLDLDPIILSEQADNGNTLLEKLEQNSDVGFAIALYTPCDEGRKKDTEILHDRARQNVVFEHGMLIGKLGRKNVCALVESEIELPSDLGGQVYINCSDPDWKIKLARNIKGSGINVDVNKLL